MKITHLNAFFGICATLFLETALPHAAAAADTNGFTFATWNIGHFSVGLKACSTIPPERAPEMTAAYRAFVAKSGASVVGLCESSDALASNGTHAVGETALADFPGRSLGPCRGNWNVLYWKNADFIRDGLVDYPARRYTGTYYQFARLRIAGREVCVVETHLDWNTMDPGHELDRVKQIQKLVDDFKNEPYVVIGGDFNTCVLDRGRGWIDAPEEFKPFADAGTCESGSTTSFVGAPTEFVTTAMPTIWSSSMCAQVATMSFGAIFSPLATLNDSFVQSTSPFTHFCRTPSM